MISYLIGWLRTPSYHSTAHQYQTKVSIVLPVRNEEKNIQNILKCLSQQNYPKENHEIIVADDFSSDKTVDLATKMNISNLRCIRLQSGGGKKKAITEAIAQASGTLIVTTDADCEMGESWLSEIVSFYEGQTPKMICGPVLMRGETNFQTIIQSQEMSVLAACGCASVYFNLPIFCSGANLAYEKKIFLEVNGYGGYEKMATGDDVFLMLKIHKKFSHSIQYLKSRTACVYTSPEKSSRAAMKQRRRWLSKSFSYGFSYITGIAILVFFTNFLILLSGILSVINIKFALAFVICFIAKYSVDFMLLFSISAFFKKIYYPVLFFVSSLIYPIYAFFMGIVLPFTNYSWKGRRS